MSGAALRTTDVARIFSEEAGRPITPATVRTYVGLSRHGRYQDNPIPPPVGEPARGVHVVWVPADGETVADLEARLRAWWHSRPGLGHGTGGPGKGKSSSQTGRAS